MEKFNKYAVENLDLRLQIEGLKKENEMLQRLHLNKNGEHVELINTNYKLKEEINDLNKKMEQLTKILRSSFEERTKLEETISRQLKEIKHYQTCIDIISKKVGVK